MQGNKKILCQWDLVRFITEDMMTKEDGSFFVLSVITADDYELMIFLGKADNLSDYEVRVYKLMPNDHYVPHPLDPAVKRFEENDQYATFIFDTYEKAHDFIDMLAYYHKEYRKRPARKVVEEI